MNATTSLIENTFTKLSLLLLDLRKVGSLLT